jgi:WD40 repeat protein
MKKLNQKRKRRRGVVLTPIGLQRLREVKIGLEPQEIGEVSTFSDKLSEISLLDLQTVKKILACKVGVDHRSLECLFDACKLELGETSFCQQDPNRRQDWGEAADISIFYGRTTELAKLEKLVFADRSRLIALQGMGGIGKTTLSIKFAQQIENKFECTIWKSLRDAPPVNEVLASLIEFLSEGLETEASLPERVGDRITRLIDYLRVLSCVIVLDNCESLFDSGSQGKYRQGYEGYGELFRRVGATSHTSCLILTTREKPSEVAILEGESYSVRSLLLEGFKEAEGLQIFHAKGLSGSESEFRQLSDRYSGNPLALKVVATTIQDLFDGNIAEFLAQESAVFGDIRDVLDQQFERLSHIEKEIMYWLAILREPASISQLRENFVFEVATIKLVEALDSLSKRSLIEKNASRFSQQPVVMEYVTSRLIEKVCNEIVTGKPELIRDHALIQATAKDYIRETQIRLIFQPLINELLANLKGQKYIEEYLTQIIKTLQQNLPREAGYTAGNILNLFCQMETNLTGFDFSNLCVWQADLRQAQLHQVNFQNADLSKTVFAENFGGIWSVAFSPDGQYLAAGDTKGDILLRRVADGQPIRTFKGHRGWVVSLDFSPDGNTLASGSCDCTAKLWDVHTGQCMHTLEEHEHEVWSVAFSPDGKTLASGCDDNKVRQWDVSTGEYLKVFVGHTNSVLSVIFNLDGRELISGSDDNTIKLWDVETGECKKVFWGHDDEVRTLSVSPDGQMLASGGNDHTIRLWNINTGECLKVLQGHSNGVWSVTFCSEANLIASGSIDQTVRLWNINTGECLKVLQGHSNWINSVAFNPQGNLLASGSYDQTIKLWNVDKYQRLKTFQGYNNQALSVVFSPNAQTLASGGHDQKIRLWDVKTGQITKTLHEHSGWIWSVAFNSQGNLLASGSGDKTVKLWDIYTGKVIKTFLGHQAVVRSVAFSSDNQIIASASEDRTVRLWNISTGQTVKILQRHQAEIWSIAFSPDGKKLASGSLDGTAKLWNVNTGECLNTLDEHESWVLSVAFSPDNKTLVTTSPDQTLRLWNVNTGICRSILRGNKGCSLLAAFSPDGQLIASCDQNHDLTLWKVDSEECLHILSGHKTLINSIAFSPDNQTLISSSEDETLQLWNIKNGKHVKTLKVKKPYENMNIKDTTGLTKANIDALKLLSVVDKQ